MGALRAKIQFFERKKKKNHFPGEKFNCIARTFNFSDVSEEKNQTNNFQRNNTRRRKILSKVQGAGILQVFFLCQVHDRPNFSSSFFFLSLSWWIESRHAHKTNLSFFLKATPMENPLFFSFFSKLEREREAKSRKFVWTRSLCKRNNLDWDISGSEKII